MKNRKYFHIRSDGEIRQISREQYFEIAVKQRHWANRKLIASVYDDEFSFQKGENFIHLEEEWIRKIMDEMRE